MSRRLATVASALVISSIALVAAAAGVAQEGGGNATVIVKGPVGLKVTGTTGNVKVTEVGDSLIVSVDIGGLNTKNTDRDKDLQKDLDKKLVKKPDKKTVDKTVVLRVKKDHLKFPADGKTISNSANGLFTLNGIEKKKPFDYTVKREGNTYIVTASKAELNMAEHGLTNICKFGDKAVCVKDEIEVSATFKIVGK